MGSIHVFATGSDWLHVFDRVEASGPVTYTRAGVSATDRTTVFRRGSDLPDLGFSRARATVECPYYLASAASSPLRTYPVTASDAVTRYYLDQRANPDTVELCLGGQWELGVLVAGSIGTISDSPASINLLRRFDRAIRRQFARIRAYRVGPEAQQLLVAGWRLTSAAHSPRLYDLAPEPGES